jgi:hypothetical protein
LLRFKPVIPVKEQEDRQRKENDGKGIQLPAYHGNDNGKEQLGYIYQVTLQVEVIVQLKTV